MFDFNHKQCRIDFRHKYTFLTFQGFMDLLLIKPSLAPLEALHLGNAAQMFTLVGSLLLSNNGLGLFDSPVHLHFKWNASAVAANRIE